MELRHLRAFLAVAQHAHFTRAARALGLAQPALSQHIAQLEDTLGVRLFERTRRGSRLTDPGRAFLPRAERVLAELAAAQSDAQDFHGLVRGRVVIGTISSIAALRLPVVLARFRAAHPGIELALREDHSAPLTALLVAGAIDLAVIHAGSIRGRAGAAGSATPGRAPRTPPAGSPRSRALRATIAPADAVSGRARRPTIGPELAQTTLAQEDLVLVLPRRHPLAGTRRVGFAALAAEPFVVYGQGSTLRDVVIAAGAACGFSPRIALEASGNDTVRAFVAAGFGVAILPRGLALAPGPPVAVVELSSPRAVRTVSIAWRRHGTLSPAPRAALAFLTEQLTDSLASPGRA